MADFQYFGTVSHGTLRTEDLIDRFCDLLKELDPTSYLQLLDGNDNAGEEFLEELFDALDTFAPDGFYFGAHPGDGSDFGFWSHTA